MLTSGCSDQVVPISSPGGPANGCPSVARQAVGSTWLGLCRASPPHDPLVRSTCRPTRTSWPPAWNGAQIVLVLRPELPTKREGREVVTGGQDDRSCRVLGSSRHRRARPARSRRRHAPAGQRGRVDPVPAHACGTRARRSARGCGPPHDEDTDHRTRKRGSPHVGRDEDAVWLQNPRYPVTSRGVRSLPGPRPEAAHHLHRSWDSMVRPSWPSRGRGGAVAAVDTNTSGSGQTLSAHLRRGLGFESGKRACKSARKRIRRRLRDRERPRPGRRALGTAGSPRAAARPEALHGPA